MNRRLLPSLLALPALCLGLAAAAPSPEGAAAQDSAPAAASIGAEAGAPARAELSVEVTGPDGKPAAALRPGDLEVRVAGAPVPASTLGAGAPDRLAIYFDLPLLASKDVLAAASSLSDRAATLAGVAPVELVVADDRARTLLPASRDPEVVSQALSGVGVRYGGRDALVAVRRDYLEELRGLAGAPETGRSRPGHRLAPDVEERIGEVTREALAEEAEILRLDRQRLVAWVADLGPVDPGGPPGALVLVTGGWDEDPLVFYRRALEAYGLEDQAQRLPRPVVLPSTAEVGRVLAAYGWLTYPFLPTAEGAGFVPTPTAPPPSVRDQQTGPRPGSIPSGGHEVGRPALITPHLGRRKDEGKEAETGLPAVAAGRDALASIAAATGGELVTDPLQIGDLAGRLRRRLRLVVPVPGGGPQPVDVRLAGAVARGAERYTVHSRTWVATTTPEAVAAVRARQLLDGELEDHGDLPVEAAFETAPSGVGEGRLTLRVGGVEGEPAPPAGARLRATVGIDRPDQAPLVFHRDLAADALPEAGLYRVPVALPAGAETRLAVVVEDLAGQRWGTAVATYLETSAGAGEAGEGATDLDLLPSPQVVHLLAPREPFVMGRTEMQAVVSDPRVRRVDFLLDGQRAAVRAAPPFRATLDFGDLPRSRRVEVVAYGEGGDELGRDTLVVNEGGGSFRVRIVEPKPSAGSASAPLTGPVEVAAEVDAPADTPVERVDFFWNTSRVASRFAPPWRQRIMVPAASPEGFVRVVARLTDGATTEDVVFLNEPGTGERLDVNLVEMYVVVTDKRGRPVSGLTADDFRVLEEGEPQKIATFSDARSLPLTVGLAIDSSASMFIKLPGVGQAAGEFVRKSLGPNDRAFVVGFGGEPKLAQTTTSDDDALLRAIADLKADGQTAIWASVVYSLVQLQGAPGKKAVIVYTDGADEDEDFSYRTALRFARRVGVPIYFILTNNEIVRTGGKGLGVRRFLGRVQRMADEVGGKIYMVRADEDLSLVYREIGRELRNQYLLAYYSKDLPEETWRRVKVVMADPGLEARTIAGTYR